MRWIWKASALLLGDWVWEYLGIIKSGMEIQEHVKELRFTIVRLIWFVRNTGVYDSPPWLAENIIDRTKAFLLDFRNDSAFSQLFLDPVPTKWVAPPLDFHKVNYLILMRLGLKS